MVSPISGTATAKSLCPGQPRIIRSLPALHKPHNCFLSRTPQTNLILFILILSQASPKGFRLDLTICLSFGKAVKIPQIPGTDPMPVYFIDIGLKNCL